MDEYRHLDVWNHLYDECRMSTLPIFFEII